MKQLLQSLKDGDTVIEEVPCPVVRPGSLLIQTSRSLISAGTERMLIDFGKAGMISKAKQQPDKVRMVLQKVRTDGLAPTVRAVRAKLDQPMPMGYSNVGTVLEVGDGVSGFSVGDRVVSNGNHAEVVCVPRNLCARIPDGVADEAAAFTVLGAIALNGVRLALPTLGESVAVTGLGLIGLMAVQILRAHGCRVLGIDFDPGRLELARRLGAETVDLSAGEDPVAGGMAFSRGAGMDAVLITAATTSNEPMHQAANMSRKRGRIILVGVTGLELSRADFYEKELSFQVSCSYGPGRYDPEYEVRGRDYPLPYVRWTEQRNFTAVLDLLSSGQLSIDSLVSHRFSFDDAASAYALLSDASALGIVLEYAADQEEPITMREVKLAAPVEAAGDISIAAIGAGNYATQILLPAFKAAGARMRSIISAGGVSSVHAGKKFGFELATTDTETALGDINSNAVVIATRHDSHADLVVRALAAGKHVFVEKPLAIKADDIERVDAAYRKQATAGRKPCLMVGFNRRFAPQIVRMKELLRTVVEPKCMIATINAGEIPAEHWLQDPTQGGGRIIGEACHFIDLLRFLSGSGIVDSQAIAIGGEGQSRRDDKATITLRFADGSIGTIHYFANGHRSFPKERIDVFCGGRVLSLDNFRRLSGYGWKGFKKLNLRTQDKGQRACAAAFVGAIKNGGPAPISYSEILEVSRATIEIARLLDS